LVIVFIFLVPQKQRFLYPEHILCSEKSLQPYPKLSGENISSIYIVFFIPPPFVNKRKAVFDIWQSFNGRIAFFHELKYNLLVSGNKQVEELEV